MAAHRAQLAQELRDEEAARRWSIGQLDMERVQTMAGTKEDRSWSGKYPAWEQLVELARLCHVEPIWFTTD
jgi:hypothetical protein